MSPVTNRYWTPAMPLIAILRGIRPDEALAHVSALVAAGFDAIEIPLNSPDWQASIQLAAQHVGERVSIGGGTVLTTSDVYILHAFAARLGGAPEYNPALLRS